MSGRRGCIRLDAGGKELSRFTVDGTSNNCLDVLPNGHILVARCWQNKITEYDPHGKVFWEVSFTSPFTAQRLTNGNTLVASHAPSRVVELDHAGKVVWECKTKTTPWFASRR